MLIRSKGAIIAWVGNMVTRPEDGLDDEKT